MKIGITGVGGFIGQFVAHEGIRRGYEVVGVDVSEEACKRVSELGVSASQGDIRDKATLMRSFTGCDAVVHTAALVVEGGDWETVRSVNVGGTVRVLSTCKALTIPRLVHLSSVMVYGFSFPDGVTESGPLRGENNPYCQTKIESEAVIRSAPDSLCTVIFRPGDVYGPGSVPWIIRPLELAKRGPLVVPDRSSFINPLHVEHLAAACIDACEPRSPAMGAYNLVDDVALPCFDYFSRLGKAVNQSTYVVPAPILRMLFGLNSRSPRRWRLNIEPDAISFLQRPGRYSGQRAQNELLHTPTVQFDRALADAIADHIAPKRRQYLQR